MINGDRVWRMRWFGTWCEASMEPLIVINGDNAAEFKKQQAEQELQWSR